MHTQDTCVLIIITQNGKAPKGFWQHTLVVECRGRWRRRGEARAEDVATAVAFRSRNLILITYSTLLRDGQKFKIPTAARQRTATADETTLWPRGRFSGYYCFTAPPNRISMMCCCFCCCCCCDYCSYITTPSTN